MFNFEQEPWLTIDKNLHSYTQDEQQQIEQAIAFMSGRLIYNCSNPKPVILHSVRVGIRLQMIGCPLEAVLAGYLHDLVEDSDYTIEDITKKFGQKVAELVGACTFDATILDYQERWHQAANKLRNCGKDAMRVKVVDCLDNHHYYPQIKDPETREKYLWKMNLLIKTFEPFLGDEPIFRTFKLIVK